MTRFLSAIAIVPAVLALNGCALFTNEHPGEGVEATHDHIKLAIKANYRSIAVLPFFNKTDCENAPLYARRAFMGALASHKNYQVMPLGQTDAALKNIPRSALDPKEFKALADALVFRGATTGATAKVDLLAFGWVINQSHRYGVCYNKNAIRARIALVDAATGDIGFDAEDERARTHMGFSFITMFYDEFFWAREAQNRYDELFRDMMAELPDRTAK